MVEDVVAAISVVAIDREGKPSGEVVLFTIDSLLQP